jgi:hypothetical protein
MYANVLLSGGGCGCGGIGTAIGQQTDLIDAGSADVVDRIHDGAILRACVSAHEDLLVGFVGQEIGNLATR